MKLWACLKSLFRRTVKADDQASMFSSNAYFARRKANSPATLHAQWIVRTDGTAPQAEAACPPGALVPGQDQPAAG